MDHHLSPACPSLQVLPGAAQHLTIISGDVSDAAALQAAMAQCEQLVHLAAVVDIAPPRDEQHRQEMIQTALDGTRMVLGKHV
jgi:nucleoside-diphosphate-sugar epimerase